MAKYNWKCPYEGCYSGSKKSNHRCIASKTGRGHLKKKHKDFITEPILIKIEVKK
jgi:hypothetical protein